MPKKAKIPCSYQGCPELIESGTGGRCEKHRKIENKRYNNSRTDKEVIKQYKTKRWYRLRKITLQYDLGLCRVCKEKNATEIDHIEEVKDGGDFWNLDNLQSICHSCHTKKTNEERRVREGSIEFNI